MVKSRVVDASPRPPLVNAVRVISDTIVPGKDDEGSGQISGVRNKAATMDSIGDLILGDDSIGHLRGTPADLHCSELGPNREVKYRTRSCACKIQDNIYTVCNVVKLTSIHSDNHSKRGEGSCATTSDSSHSEGVGCSRSESTNSVCPTIHIHHSSNHTSPTILFLELHHVVSDDPILINAFYGIPGHHGSPGCCGIHHSARKSSGGYIQKEERENND